MKVNTEGYEWNLLPYVLKNINKESLPRQMAFRVRLPPVQVADATEEFIAEKTWNRIFARLMKLFFSKGYGVAHTVHAQGVNAFVMVLDE